MALPVPVSYEAKLAAMEEQDIQALILYLVAVTLAAVDLVAYTHMVLLFLQLSAASVAVVMVHTKILLVTEVVALHQMAVPTKVEAAEEDPEMDVVVALLAVVAQYS